MTKVSVSRWRLGTVSVLMGLALAGLIWRFVDLAIVDRAFLMQQGAKRMVRVLTVPAHRGMIADRNGVPLAISSPVDSVWVNPQQCQPSTAQLIALARLLDLKPAAIQSLLQSTAKRGFVYLKRGNPLAVGNQVKALAIPGVYLQREYKRFYPQGAITAHVLGFTDVDDRGQEGLELAYNSWLGGTPGKRQVIRDRLNQVVADVSEIQIPVQGKDLIVSLDLRIQYIAYRDLTDAMQTFHAEAATAVVLDSQTGEVLAMVNQPSYDPNNRSGIRDDGLYRNRAVTDMFEPGSTIKPFTIALALMSGRYKPTDRINTSPGKMTIGGYTIQDDGYNYGILTLGQILQKSSNIGAAKILLSLSPAVYWHLLRQLGFGQDTQSGFPGEVSGRLPEHAVWRPSVVATMAYGYGVAVTALQMAHAFTVFANHGVLKPILLLKANPAVLPPGTQVLPREVSDTVLAMLENVVELGTGRRAQIMSYRLAGKTGTAYIAGPEGYDKQHSTSSFVAIAPVTNPRLVVMVVVRNPQGESFGAIVAAPTAAKIMEESLRILNVLPDKQQP